MKRLREYNRTGWLNALKHQFSCDKTDIPLLGLQVGIPEVTNPELNLQIPDFYKVTLPNGFALNSVEQRNK